MTVQAIASWGVGLVVLIIAVYLIGRALGGTAMKPMGWAVLAVAAILGIILLSTFLPPLPFGHS